VQPMELSDEPRSQDVLSGDPLSLLWSVSLLVNQVLHTPSTALRPQKAPNRVGEMNLASEKDGEDGKQRSLSEQFDGPRETWKVGWIHMVCGSQSISASGLMILWMGKGPMNQGASFFDSTRRGRLRVESHTFWPSC